MNDGVLINELEQLAAQSIGLRIPDNAHDRFAVTVRERAAHQGYNTLADYRTFLAGRQAAKEWEEIARVFTSTETFFYRDHGQFDLLRLRVLPELIARHRHDKTLRLWSAGCASGEEAYSLAMLLDLLLPEQNDWNILVLGTDIDSAAIEKARRGCYRAWSFRMVPDELQQRYFHLDGREWVLDERIRSMVTFRVSNLVADPCPDAASELHDMDLILCRNVFIYFDPAAVIAVANRLTGALREGGYLMTAHTELIGHTVSELESRLFAEGVVYQRHTSAIPAPHSAVRNPHSPIGNQQSSAPNDELLLQKARAHADRGEFDLAEQTCHKALSANPLAAAPYFLLAQLAQIRGDFDQAKDFLNKALYLDHRFVAAHLELAALYERAGDMARAHALRRAALVIVSAMPVDAVIEPCETTAGELAHWLEQWEKDMAS